MPAIPGVPSMPLPSLTGGAGGSAGPSSSSPFFDGMTSGMFDASGWTVATGASRAQATGTGSGAGLSGVPWTMIVLAGLAALVLWKKLK